MKEQIIPIYYATDNNFIKNTSHLVFDLHP